MERINADVIILGCTLPGIVTAHKLKSKFGDSMDIVVLDLAGSQKSGSKCNVAFQEDRNTEGDKQGTDSSPRIDTITQYYITKFANEFNIPLLDSIIEPKQVKSSLNKIFQYENGNAVECNKDFREFEYLSFLEKFELNQYLTLLDHNIRDLFLIVSTKDEKKKLLYYDRTTMEEHISDALIFSTSRKIMRTAVQLTCGAPATDISVLFYLHQCFRSNGSANNFDGNKTKIHEKLLGYCRKRLTSKLQQSVADITLITKPIKEIRTYADERVILETIKGGKKYVCNLLAMALKPDQLNNIQVEDQLLSENYAEISKFMTQGKARKFLIQYEEDFWSRQGYSGDILSIRGPIIWSMQRPRMSSTGSLDKYSALVGFLIASDENTSSREAVLEQLVKLFGEEASKPVSYKETDIADVFVPRCGDYVALRRWTTEGSPKYLEWGALDIFGDGDVASALEAGNTAYLHLLSCLRPQAQSFEDLTMHNTAHLLYESPFKKWIAQINIISGLRFFVLSTVLLVGVSVLKSYLRRGT